MARQSTSTLRLICQFWLALGVCFSVCSATVAQETTLPLRGPKQADSQFSGVVYGPITDQDTLWRIAERYRQNPGLSLYQVMVAIYELNPTAFERENLNLLVNGSVLKLPSERYVARINPDQAKQRALSDEQAFARMSRRPGDSLRNLKPPQPLVNQDDLNTTKRALEGQLNRLDEEQTRQFESLRQQFAQSMNNLELMLDENRRLFGRLDQVNEQLQTLRSQVENDVQVQIDQQTALQRQLLALIQEERALRAATPKSQGVSANTLSILFIAISVLLTIGGITAALLWWRKQQASAPQQEATSHHSPVASAPIAAAAGAATAAATAAVAASVSEPEDDIINDLSDDELFNDDDLLDDVLSAELEESLDAELESFTELDDSLLVPEENNDPFEDGTGILDQDDLDSLFDEEGLNFDGEDELSSVDSIDLSDEADPVDEQLAILDEDDDEDSKETAAEDAAEDDTILGASNISPIGEQSDMPEISIDELLGQDFDEATEDEQIELLDEASLEELDAELDKQGQQLDRMTDELLAEVDQLEMMGVLGEDLDDLFDEEETLASSSTAADSLAIQDIDALLDDDIDDPLGDELLSELTQQEEEKEQQLDALSDELLAELEQLNADDEPTNESEEEMDIDTLLQELDSDEDILDEASEAEQEDDFIDVDALLAETGDDIGIDEEDLNLNLEFSVPEGMQEGGEVDEDNPQSANLDLARVYLEMDDTDAARELLEEVIKEGDAEQQQEARELMASLG